MRRFRLRRSSYRTVCVCLFCGISSSLSGPWHLHAQSLLTPVSLAANENRADEGRIYMNWEGRDDPEPQETSQIETSDVSAKPQVGGTGQSLASAETTTEPGKPKKKAHRGALVPAPLPISSPTVGVGIVPGLGYIFPFSTNDKVSPPSTIGAAGLFTNNGSRGFGVGADLYMKENTYEITSIYAHGNVNYDLYGSGIAEGLKLPLTQSGHLFRAEVLRRLW